MARRPSVFVRPLSMDEGLKRQRITRTVRNPVRMRRPICRAGVPAAVYHRLEDRIRAHVLLCWLALLLARIVETRTDTTWPRAHDQLQRLHAGTFTGPAGLFRQTSTPSPEI